AGWLWGVGVVAEAFGVGLVVGVLDVVAVLPVAVPAAVVDLVG
ncbi:hypothetical protein SAMN04488576_1561, partial [Bacillus sp. cl25]